MNTGRPRWIGVTVLLLSLCVVASACSGSSGSQPSASSSPTGADNAPSPPPTDDAVPAAGSSVGEADAASDDSDRGMSDEAATYLAEAIATMRELSINRDRVDWGWVDVLTTNLAEGAVTPADTHRAIAAALSEMRDDHSVFLSPTEADTFHDSARFEPPIIENRQDGLGYVSIDGYQGDIGELADDYAKDLAEAIDSLSPRPCGWLLDLRDNGGGNMWPMLAGVAPLLGEGVVGSFTYPDGRTESWELVDGSSRWNGLPMSSGADPGATGDQVPIAVLIGASTASSGEAVTVAFSGGDRIRLFGRPTAGLTTANEPVELSDGAILILTMSSFTDRNGLSYGQGVSVEPDVVAGSGPAADGAEPIDRAAEWLLGQDECRS